MKIGILTHHYVDNYGAFLQVYALQQAILKTFPDAEVEVINYINIRHMIINRIGWWRFYRDKETLPLWKKKTQIHRIFQCAKRRYLHESKICFTSNGINRMHYDVIVVGSDEVWNFTDNKANAKVKFGAGLTCPNIISYAASVGKSTYTEELPSYVVEGIRSFSAVSARDDATAELAQNLGVSVTRVLDPTFLINFPLRNVESTKRQIDEPYILFYYCDDMPYKVKSQLIRQAKKAGYHVYGAGEADHRYSKPTINITPFEWVELFRHASYVFTGTFHGAVFSILHEKQFSLYIGSNVSRVRKIQSLLTELGIEDRNMNANTEFDFQTLSCGMESIDYEKVNKSIQEKRKHSIDYIRRAVCII